MAIAALDRLSEDKIARQMYQRRMDELLVYNNTVKKAEMAEAAQLQAEAERQRAEAAEVALADKETEIKQLRSQLAELQTKLNQIIN